MNKRQHHELWLEAALSPEAPIPDWVAVLMVLATLIAFGIAGQLDYEAERGLECNQQGLYYDAGSDVCTPRPVK